MSASNDYCLGQFKIVMTKIINYLYECTLANQRIKLPWKKLSQKEIEKVFGRVVNTYSAGQPGALRKWLERFPKIKWQLDNEGNLQIDLYHAAYTCLCLDLTVVSTASRRIEALPSQERHIVGYVLGGLEKMDKTEITLDILQKLIVESVNEASTITPDNSIVEPDVGPTPKTKLIDSLRAMNRDLLADLSGTRGDRNDAEHECDQLKQQLDRQQASHLNEVTKLKARIANLENLSQKIQLSLDEKSGKLTVLEGQLVERQKNNEDVALSQRKVIAHLETEVDEKNRQIATLRIQLEKQKNMVTETPLLASGSNQDVLKRDAQTSFHRDSLPGDDTESTINVTMEVTNNLAAEMMQYEINELKQTVERQNNEIQQLIDQVTALKHQVIEKDEEIVEKNQRRLSALDHLENLQKEMKRKSVAAKTQYEKLIAKCEENIRMRQREVEEWKNSRDIYVRRWAEEKKISDELYRRAQLAAIIENPDISQTDDTAQSGSQSITSTSNANSNDELIENENISETSADVINFSVAGFVDLTADNESDDDGNGSQTAADAIDPTTEEESEDEENADVADVSTDDESENNDNPAANDSFVPGKIPDEAFFVNAKKVGKKLVDDRGFVFKKINPKEFHGRNGRRWVCVGEGRIYCPVRLFRRKINGEFRCYATERLEHNHGRNAEVQDLSTDSNEI